MYIYVQMVIDSFWMQLNIAMKFAECVSWIVLCKHCKYGGKNYYNSRDIEFFLGVTFWACLIHLYVASKSTLASRSHVGQAVFVWKSSHHLNHFCRCHWCEQTNLTAGRWRKPRWGSVFSISTKMDGWIDR